MNTNDIKEIIELLKEKSYKYSLDGFISGVYYVLREIFICNGQNLKNINDLLGNLKIKGMKVKTEFVWYLGDKKKCIIINLKKPLDIPIDELELIQMDNYCND